jgi:hypothetical protein
MIFLLLEAMKGYYQTVAVPIPIFDRGKGDSRNLLGRIIEVFNLTIFL